MIDHAAIDRFLAGVRGQALREGTRYAREARVGGFIGSPESVSSVVRGATGDFEVALWAAGEGIEHRCTCPSWRNPCKHEVAAALVLRQCLAAARPPAPRAADETHHRAVEERIVAARREPLRVRPETPPFLRVESPSGFAYRVHLRGGAAGPHSCDCPDFEANRLHTCKHVERVRLFLRSPRGRLAPAFRREAERTRVYLHFGEVVEPRLYGTPMGPGAGDVNVAFDAAGLSVRPLARDEGDLRLWLADFGRRVEPEALAWLDDRLRRRPVLPNGKFARLLPPLGLAPYPYQ